MTGIRVDELCREFENRSSYPAGLINKVDEVCFGAFSGNQDVFTREEALKTDSRKAKLFASTGGSWNFAKLMVQTPRYRLGYSHASDTTLWKAFVNGMSQVSPGEPPFFVNGYAIEKLSEDDRSLRVQINRKVVVQFFKSEEGLSNRVAVEVKGLPTLFSSPEILENFIGGALHAGSTGEVKDTILALPFMERFSSGALAERPSRFNSSSANHPKTLARHDLGASVFTNLTGSRREERRLFADGFGRLFVEWGTNRYYLDRADGYEPEILFSWNGKKRVFKPYVRPKPERISSLGGFCFSGDTQLQTQAGSINTQTLFQQYQRGEAIPPLASLNPTTGRVVYQKPWRVSQRFVDPALQQGVQLISYQEAAGKQVEKPLELTANHFVWVKRGGREYWIPAGDIGSGDQLLLVKDEKKQWGLVTGNSYVKSDAEIALWKRQHQGMQGPSFSFAEIAQRPADGALEVYAVAFKPVPGEFHNLAIASKDGAWVVVHNDVK